MDRKTLRSLFYKSLNQFLFAEVENILSNVSERNLCSRLSNILEYNAHKAGFKNYYADVEYNRKQNGEVKTIINREFKIIQICCDLILHSRGEMIARDNLIAVEMKKSERPDKHKDKDRERLIALTKSSFNEVWSADGSTHPDHVCGYEMGFYVELDVKNRTSKVEEYSLGKKIAFFEKALPSNQQ